MDCWGAWIRALGVCVCAVLHNVWLDRTVDVFTLSRRASGLKGLQIRIISSLWYVCVQMFWVQTLCRYRTEVDMPFISCLCRNTSSHSSNKFISCSLKPLICSDLIQGLHPSKDPVFAAFEGESFRETLLTSSVVVKRGGLAFGAFPGCVTRCFTLTSRFLPPRPAKVTIYATRCRHFLSFFLLF